MTPTPATNAVTGGRDLVHAVLLGGDVEALSWVPRLFRDPRINLLGLLPTHPADLVRHLAVHGYALADPCPLTLFADVPALKALSRLDLIIDTTLDPGQVRRLAEAGLEGVPRVNSGALELLLAGASGPAAGVPGDRAPFLPRLTKEIGRAFRHGRTLGLVVVEVSPGRPGAPLSNGAVERLAQAIEQSLRIEDVVAHLGNGTFAVLLPETGEATRQVAARLTSHLAPLRIPSGAPAPVSGAARRPVEGVGTPGGTGREGEAERTPSPARPAPEAGRGAGPALHLAVGWSWFPHDARTAQALLEQARERKGRSISMGP